MILDTTPYTFAQFHWHWGPNSTAGSEHTIDSKKYALELHLVHYRSNFNSLATAVASKESDALAVLGILFYENATTSDFNLPRLLNPTLITTGQGTMAPVDIPAMVNIFANLDKFYRYDGSLTTPGCNQVVRWTVLSEPLPVSTRFVRFPAGWY
ncbi:hypothetical protein Ciccas_007116 [Cichlidogyrus casuarinus]|uniref:Carbonic anhydrase n=1 Tax=Cichlidogyrus casuarinus TaxID=1844966 RepID=A0ABD2Q3S1_9PLAT